MAYLHSVKRSWRRMVGIAALATLLLSLVMMTRFGVRSRLLYERRKHAGMRTVRALVLSAPQPELSTMGLYAGQPIKGNIQCLGAQYIISQGGDLARRTIWMPWAWVAFTGAAVGAWAGWKEKDEKHRMSPQA